jgi:hypothetical protein
MYLLNKLLYLLNQLTSYYCYNINLIRVKLISTNTFVLYYGHLGLDLDFT